MNPRPSGHHLPTLTEVVDEASIIPQVDLSDAGLAGVMTDAAHSPTDWPMTDDAPDAWTESRPAPWPAHVDVPILAEDFSTEPEPQARHPERLPDARPGFELHPEPDFEPEAPYEATISDHQIRRALAEAEAAARQRASEIADVAAEPKALVDGSGADAWVDVPTDPKAFEPPPVIDEAELSARVLADVHRQLDVVFEHHLREAVAPLLARVADAVATEARDVLASSLRDIVSRAVSQEIERQRGR